MIRHLAAAALVMAAFATPAAHADVSVSSGTRGATIGSLGPIGESFVADGSGLASFGFQFATANAGATNAVVTFQLLSGTGLTGSLLATRTATLPVLAGRTPVWYDFDLTGTTLFTGQSYTALLSTTSTRLALIFGPNLSTSGVPASGDAYAAGTLVSANPVDAFCTTGGTCDANFRFTTLAAAVPEPATWLTMVLGLGMIGMGLRSRGAAGVGAYRGSGAPRSPRPR